jgi:hypothetical protein
MKQVFVLICSLTPALFAQPESETNGPLQNYQERKLQFKFSPAAFHMFGHTDYEFELTQTVVDTNGEFIDLTTRSLLEFPLNAFLIGGTVGIKSPEGAPNFWGIEIGVFTNINDPGNSMIDSDWLTLENYFSETKFSHTESDAKMDVIDVSLEATREVVNLGSGGIGLLAGFRYLKIEQQEIGYEGWFRDLDSNLTFEPQEPVSGVGPVLNYEITYKGPQFGTFTRINLNRKIELNLKAAVSLTWINDFDDHLLRGFHTFADGTGLGILSDLRVRWFTKPLIGSKETCIDLYGSYDHYQADLTKNFYQYADGGPFEQPLGFSTGGLPHDIKSEQFKVGIMLGIGL